MSKSYDKAGVSLSRGYDAVRRIQQHVERTRIPGVMGAFGSFGAAFDLSAFDIPDPVLVSGTDGVGTKLLVAQAANRHDTIGIDLVAMCVNDIVALGAKPLYFLDYIATGMLDPTIVEAIVSGIADGCEAAGCALIGGETAEMPDMYQSGHYDLAGFATGILSKADMISPELVQEGDIVIGLPSSGLHSNGFSLVRKILFQDHAFDLDDHVEELGEPLVDALLAPTKIYVRPVLEVLTHHDIHGIAHITGGGFYENIPRVLPDGMGIVLDLSRIPIPPIFPFLQTQGQMSIEEMYHVFNMGVGMVLVVPPADTDEILHRLATHRLDATILGQVVRGAGVTIQ
jgi:phosphoribosylformylglycinamidine cyclo-ligase